MTVYEEAARLYEMTLPLVGEGLQRCELLLALETLKRGRETWRARKQSLREAADLSLLTALRSDLLPTWLGWVGVSLFVVVWTPVGFLAFALSGIWILLASIVLYRRGEPARSELGQMASARPAQAARPS